MPKLLGFLLDEQCRAFRPVIDAYGYGARAWDGGGARFVSL
jgi:hypothetical protein